VKDVANETFATCDAEWKLHGTCCNRDELLIFNQHEQDLLRYNGGMTGRAIDNSIKLLKRKTQTPLPSKEILAKLKMANQSHEKCRKKLLSLRGPALCSICSGRSEIFFNNNKDKAFIDLETCKRTVDVCEPYFESMGWLGANSDDFIEEIKNIMPSAPLFNLTTLFELIDKYKPPQKLSDAFERYGKAKMDADNDFKKDILAANLCSVIINIRQKPFVRFEELGTQDIETRISFALRIKREHPEITNIRERKKIALRKQRIQFSKVIRKLEEISVAERRVIENSHMYLKEVAIRRLQSVSTMKREALLKKNHARIEEINLEAEKQELNYYNNNKAYQELVKTEKVTLKGIRALKKEKYRQDSNSLAKAMKELQQTQKLRAIPTKEPNTRRLSLQNGESRNLNSALLLSVKPSLSGLFSTSDSLVLIKTNSTDMIKAFSDVPAVQVACQFSPLLPMNFTLSFP
jgi:hypothetical protein